MDIETLTIKQIKEYVKVLEQIAEDRDMLLKAIPPCPTHGPCMPHALEWINRQKIIHAIKKEGK